MGHSFYTRSDIEERLYGPAFHSANTAVDCVSWAETWLIINLAINSFRRLACILGGPISEDVCVYLDASVHIFLSTVLTCMEYV